MIEDHLRDQKNKFNEQQKKLKDYINSKVLFRGEVEERDVESPKPDIQSFEIGSSMVYSRIKLEHKEKPRAPEVLLKHESIKSINFDENSEIKNKNLLLESEVFPKKVQPVPIQPELNHEEERNMRSHHKQMIFDNSQDLYYKNIETDKQIQEVNFGSNFMGSNGIGGGNKKSKRLIRVSQV